MVNHKGFVFVLCADRIPSANAKVIPIRITHQLCLFSYFPGTNSIKTAVSALASERGVNMHRINEHSKLSSFFASYLVLNNSLARACQIFSCKYRLVILKSS